MSGVCHADRHLCIHFMLQVRLATVGRHLPECLAMSGVLAMSLNHLDLYIHFMLWVRLDSSAMALPL